MNDPNRRPLEQRPIVGKNGGGSLTGRGGAVRVRQDEAHSDAQPPSDAIYRRGRCKSKQRQDLKLKFTSAKYPETIIEVSDGICESRKPGPKTSRSRKIGIFLCRDRERSKPS